MATKGYCTFPSGANLFETSIQSGQYKTCTADYGLGVTAKRRLLSGYTQQIASQREEFRFLREVERSVVLRLGHYGTKCHRNEPINQTRG